MQNLILGMFVIPVVVATFPVSVPILAAGTMATLASGVAKGR